MLFLVHMVVNVPHDMPKAEWEALVATEKAYAQELQRSGHWAELWRVVVNTPTTQSLTFPETMSSTICLPNCPSLPT
jgi:hypothetical protein